MNSNSSVLPDQVVENPVLDDSIATHHGLTTAAETVPPPQSILPQQQQLHQVLHQQIVQVQGLPVAAPKQSIRSVHNSKPPRIILEHFDLSTYKLDTAHGYVEADCRHCSHTIKGQRNVTSNFIQHMRRRHHAAYRQFTANSGPRSKRPRLSSKADKSQGSSAVRTTANGVGSSSVSLAAIGSSSTDGGIPGISVSLENREGGLSSGSTLSNSVAAANSAVPINGNISRSKQGGGYSGGKSNIRDRIMASGVVAGIAAAAAITPDVTLEKALVSPTYREAKVTPCEFANELSAKLGCHVWIKREDLQPTGSPIFRAAFNYVASTPTSRSGVIVGMPSAPSVALATQKSGKPCVAYVPKNTPAAVVRTLQKYGSIVNVAGETDNESCRAALNKGTSVNRTYVDLAGKHLLTGYAEATAGYATLALEILQQLPVADKVFMPAGNALMFSGVSAVLQRLGRSVKLIGVRVADALHASSSNEMRPTPMVTDMGENGQSLSNNARSLEESATQCYGEWVRGRLDTSWGEETGTEADFDADGDWKAFVTETVTVSHSEMNAAVKSVFEDCEGAILSPVGVLSVAGAVKYWEREQVAHERFVCVVSDPLRDFDTLRMVTADCFRHDTSQHFSMVDCDARDSESVVALMSALHGRTENRARVTHIEFDGKWPFVLGVTVEDRIQHQAHLETLGFRLTSAPRDLSLQELHSGVTDDVCRHASIGTNIEEAVCAYGVRIREGAEAVTRFVAEVGAVGRLRTLCYRRDGSSVANIVVSWYLVSSVEQVEQEVASRVQSFRKLSA